MLTIILYSRPLFYILTFLYNFKILMLSGKLCSFYMRSSDISITFIIISFIKKIPYSHRQYGQKIKIPYWSLLSKSSDLLLFMKVFIYYLDFSCYFSVDLIA